LNLKAFVYCNTWRKSKIKIFRFQNTLFIRL